MAILLVITLPFLGAILGSAKGANKQRNSAIMAIVGGATLVIILGIILNRSLAGYGLALPVVITTALLVLPPKRSLRLGALALAGFCSWQPSAPSRPAPPEAPGLGRRRRRPWSRGMKCWSRQCTQSAISCRGDRVSGRSGASINFMKAATRFSTTYVIHAHDDYIELALELGVAGILLMIAFLAWWARAVWRAWRDAEAGIYARAASIATAAILVHSLVDFPLRTAAIDAAFAMCLALLIDRRAPVARERSDLWPTRHVVLK